MKKTIITLMTTAMITLVTSSAFASFTNGDLIQVVYDYSAFGIGSEVATDLGSISSLATSFNTIVSNIGSGSRYQNIQYYAVNQTGTTDNISIAGTAPLTYVRSYSAGAALSAVNTYYSAPGTDGTLSTNAYGLTVASADLYNPDSLFQKAFQSGTSPGSFGGLFNIVNAQNAYANLANLDTTPINFTLYTFANTRIPLSNITTPGVDIEIASNGNVIINATSNPSTPIPPAIFLMGSGLIGLFGFKKRKA